MEAKPTAMFEALNVRGRGLGPKLCKLDPSDTFLSSSAHRFEDLDQERIAIVEGSNQSHTNSANRFVHLKNEEEDDSLNLYSIEQMKDFIIQVTDTRFEATDGQTSGQQGQTCYNDGFLHSVNSLPYPPPIITHVPGHLVHHFEPNPQSSYPRNVTTSTSSESPTSRRPTRIEQDGDDGLDSFICFYEIVETKLELSKRKKRDFAQLQRMMEVNPGFDKLPVGSRNTKHKFKFQFEERRTKSQIEVWKKLVNEVQGEKTVNFGEYFPQCDELSEEFRDWFYPYLIDLLLKEKQKNAGSILELAQPDRETFLKELQLLHNNKKDCVEIFSPLYTPADVEASIIWCCRCFTCASMLPQISKYQSDDDFQIIPQHILEEFRMDFMKLKAKQMKDILIAHRDRVDLVDLSSFPHFLGWGRPRFVRTLELAHRKTSCRICNNKKNRKRIREELNENPDFESGNLQQIERPYY